MKKSLILLGMLALTPLAKGQLLLEALDAPDTRSITLPAGLTLTKGEHFIASVYDRNYLPYIVPSGPAAWTAVDPDSTPETTVIDIQGSIPATGISVQILITATGNVTLPAFASEAIAIDPQGEQGVSNSTRKVVLSWAQQSITASTKFITATIKPADNQVLNVKKLDLNSGLGNDNKGVVLASIPLPKSSQNATDRVAYEVRVIPGIPDRKIGETDKKHDFLYMPIEITGTNGYKRTWLNNNLGAEYANINNPNGNFNPTQQAISHDDYKAYGSLFQWQRPADGHELITWTSATAGNTSSSTTVLSSNSNWTAGHSNFIINRNYPFSWVRAQINVSSNNKNLWQTNGANNPCPNGFHVPSKSDWNELTTALGADKSSYFWAKQTPLHLPSAGWRHATSDLRSTSTYGWYWSVSEYNRDFVDILRFGDGSDLPFTGGFRSVAGSVRCIADN